MIIVNITSRDQSCIINNLKWKNCAYNSRILNTERISLSFFPSLSNLILHNFVGECRRLVSSPISVSRANMESVSHLVKVSVPNYLADLPIPNSIGGWFRLGSNFHRVLFMLYFSAINFISFSTPRYNLSI